LIVTFAIGITMRSINTTFSIGKNGNHSIVMNADYSKLNLLLKNKKWQEADLETRSILLEASDRKESITLNTIDIKAISCRDIKAIDQIWSKYSGGKFGLEVQSRIWDMSDRNYLVFSNSVGWFNNGSWSKQENGLDLTNLGSLPRAPWWGIMNTTEGAAAIFDRINTCQKE
jgi:GUN4-like